MKWIKASENSNPDISKYYIVRNRISKQNANSVYIDKRTTLLDYCDSMRMQLDDIEWLDESSTSTDTAHTEELSTPPVREVKSKEELKLKLSVIISATNTSGNQKLDAIMELFTQFTPHKEGYSVEDMEKAYAEGNKMGLAGYSMLSKHTEYNFSQLQTNKK